MYFPLSDSRIVQVDMLRAFAVSLVVCYHVSPSSIPGGFLGVDIFFVISGFVVTENIKKMKGSANNKILTFYGKRIRRLVPNVLCTVLMTYNVFYFLSDAARKVFNETYSKSGSFGAVGMANMYYALRQKNYFDSDQVLGLDPFLHFWSLGVEEQFYLLFPWLLVFMEVPKFLVVMMLSALLSFQISLHASKDVAFYTLASRFWQLALGCIATFVPIQQPLIGHWTRVVLYIFILMSCFFDDSDGGVPIPVSVIPSSVTAILLCSYKASELKHSQSEALTVVYDISAYIGRLSYAIYLIHWPILCAFRISHPANGSIVALCVPFIVALSMVLHHSVENLVRFRTKCKWTPLLLVVLSLGLSAFLWNISSIESKIEQLRNRDEISNKLKDTMHKLKIDSQAAKGVQTKSIEDSDAGTHNDTAINETLKSVLDERNSTRTKSVDKNLIIKRRPVPTATPSRCACRLERSTRGFHKPEIDDKSPVTCMRDISSEELQSSMRVSDFKVDLMSVTLFNFFQMEYGIPSNCAPCFGRGNGDLCLEAGNLCSKKSFGDKGVVYVIGDSKAVGIMLIVSDILKGTGWGFAWYAGPNCGVYVGKDCGRENYDVFVSNLERRFSEGDIVIVTGMGERMTKESTRVMYEPIIDIVTNAKGTLMLVGDNPWYDNVGPLIHNGCDHESCDVNFDPRKTFIQDMTIWSQGKKSVTYFDTASSVWCKDFKCMSTVPGTKSSITWDATHLTGDALKYLRPFLCSALSHYI